MLASDLIRAAHLDGSLYAQVKMEDTKSMFGKVYTAFARRLNISRIIDTSMRVPLVCTFHS